MADRRGPLADWARRFAALDGPVGLVERPFRTQVDVRVELGTAAAERVLAVIGAPLPAEPCTYAETGDTQLLWLGPDEWLAVGGSPDLVARLRAAVGEDGSAVDVSAQRTVIEVSGPGARALLAQGCAIDLDPRTTPSGSCPQTLVAQAGVILLVREGAYELYVRSSFAGYLADWLLDATVEHSTATR